jgi:hypothetical protein
MNGTLRSDGQSWTEKQAGMTHPDRECPAERILGNQAMVQLLSLKLETEGEEAAVAFLESLGCSDIEKVLQAIGES